MSTTPLAPSRKTIRDITALKKAGTPVVCLTAYTFPAAKAMDEEVDLILVGDSVGMVVYGMDSTIPVTMDIMIAHGKAVANATKKALVVVDMPFGSYQESPQQAYRNAVRLLQETGCQAVKLEGGQEMEDTIAFLTMRGVAVMGHIGLQPQSVNAVGGYQVFGRQETEEHKIKNDAAAVARAGAFSIVIECTAESLAKAITEKSAIPTIGIGASAACDGQILVTEDMVGLTGKKPPKFVHQYANMSNEFLEAVQSYATDVRARTFPRPENTFKDCPKKNGPA